MSHRGHAGCAIFLTSVATICTTQLTRSAQNQLHAPGFVAYLHIALMSLMLPLAWLIRKEGGRILASVKDVAMFLPLWVISNYCLVQALALAPAGLVQCLFGTSPAQVCLLSRIFLHEPFTFWRLLAIAFAFGGVLALAAHSHFQGDSAMDVLLGTLCGLSAVVAAACYKVAFKVRLGTPPVYVVLGVVGTLGFVAAFLGLPLVVLLAWLNVEDRWWSSSSAQLSLVPYLWIGRWSWAARVAISFTTPRWPGGWQ
ncbi:Solute carrier family 35 member F4 [Durusdinium trenchii]|uniref:Solute carrier family 35 member F4 n=1 Tax=Durusdinium trenchii TaxID=1381693 RepID=A0ABP0QM99_9DINO